MCWAKMPMKIYMYFHPEIVGSWIKSQQMCLKTFKDMFEDVGWVNWLEFGFESGGRLEVSVTY